MRVARTRLSALFALFESKNFGDVVCGVPCGFLFSDARATSAMCFSPLSPGVGDGEKDGGWGGMEGRNECEEKNLFRRSERAAFVVKLGFSILEFFFPPSEGGLSG